MDYLKIIFVTFLTVFCVLNVEAQKIILGPKKVTKTESIVPKKTESQTTPPVNRESNKRKDNSRINRTGQRRSSYSPRVDYTRYNEGLVSAAENGDVKACHCLGHLYDQEYGYNGVIPDEEKAIKWYTLAADQGDYCAQIDLVFHCLNWPKSSKALETVRKYAEKGNVCMQSSLGFYYMNKFNYSDAITWLRTAVDNDNVQDESYNDNGYPAQVEAWFLLGKCYYEGLGVEKDIAIGQTWMKKAAKAGLSSAVTYLEEHKN